MRLVRYNPLNELALWGNSFNNFFNDDLFKPETDKSWYPAVDILNEKKSVVLNIELPGLKKEDISVKIEDRVLTIEGERKIDNEKNKETYYRRERTYGSFKRSFNLSDDVLIDDVDASFKDGVLKLTLKKDNTKEELKQITIN
ncbi:MAG: Hsp20/alpha crystallin family protein [Deltaproteobacteria bacterium]|jgi:HSP20 family protein|nr:Hsp20/alpha crystallin family protein [Deltaproteobacteria bacterium]